MSKTLIKKIDNDSVYIIAELGINHNGKIKFAKKLIDSAKRAGVDAVKFQTYITEKRVEPNSPIYNVLKKCELPFSSFKILKSYCKKKGIDFFSTPFDIDSAEYLNKIGVKIFKIASFDISNKIFLRKISKLNKIFILSTGMSTEKEINNAIKILNKKRNKIILLHCVSSYPNLEEDSHLNCITQLKKKFPFAIGLSDHTNDIYVPTLAVALGAVVIEKHFIINRRHRCVDKSVSVSENQMKKFVFEVKRVKKIMGKKFIGIKRVEKNSLVYKRIT